MNSIQRNGRRAGLASLTSVQKTLLTPATRLTLLPYQQSQGGSGSSLLQMQLREFARNFTNLKGAPSAKQEAGMGQGEQGFDFKFNEDQDKQQKEEEFAEKDQTGEGEGERKSTDVI
mmetsp:Transcript_8608/g.14549  ORF Transcript_8608/g.14549 Transcript_8608/m.14549 type:complete len:117 (-) Transcript_8608:1388-1738(-)